MMAGLSLKTAVRSGTTLPLLLTGLLLLPGCDESYPDDLSYPLRSDPIVLKTPDGSPTQLDAPGQLEQWIDSLPAKGGKLLDPWGTSEKQKRQHQLAKINEFLAKGHFDLTKDEAREAGLSRTPDDKDEVKKELEDKRDALKKIETMLSPAGPLNKVLVKLFGTPAKPKVDVKDADDHKLDEKTLAEGSRLYRRHCLHCHGLTGDGRGPTAPWVNPHPRDYRAGKFKFTSSAEQSGTRKARREDLLRTLQQGVEGTSMPSFALLDRETELEPLVSYVIHLSLRGQVEIDVLRAFLEDSDEEADADAVKKRAREKLQGGETATGRHKPGLWDYWKATEKKPINVGKAAYYTGKTRDELDADGQKDQDQSIRRGFNQFTTGTAQCRSCHNDFGRANDYKYDEWGTIVRPANLTAGIYRGGRRPLDLYYRIHSGINGAGMTSFFGPNALSSDDIWDVVNFLEAMPYPKMLPPDVRDQVYGKK